MESFLKGREKVGKAKLPREKAGGLAGLGGAAEQARPPAAPAAGHRPGNPHEPKVELVAEDGVVSKIVVTCTCGQRIELMCEY